MTNVPVLPCFRIAVPVCETGSSHGRAWATALSRDRARRYRLLPGATRDVRQAVQPVHLWSSWNGEDGLLELRASRTQGELWQQVAERLCNRRILWNTVGRSRNPPRHLSCRANTICFYHVIIHFSYSVSISPSRILRSQNFTQNQGNSAVFGGVCDFSKSPQVWAPVCHVTSSWRAFGPFWLECAEHVFQQTSLRKTVWNTLLRLRFRLFKSFSAQ